jgi:hypothetical protein
MFYDGPQKPEGIFDAFFDFLEIPVIETSASFFEFLKILPSSDPFAGKRSVIPHVPAHLPGKLNIAYCRAYFSSVSVLEYSASLLSVLVNETLVSNRCPSFPPPTTPTMGHRSDQLSLSECSVLG